MEKNVKLPDAFLEGGGWQHAKNSIWPATVFIIERNIDPFVFPKTLSDAEAVHISEVIQKALKPHLTNPLFLTNETITPLEKEFIFEHFVLTEGYERFDAGRALVVDDSSEVLGVINVEDHLHLHIFSFEPDLQKMYKKVALLETEMSKGVNFSFSERFGYLTSDPHRAGTGLVLQAFLHIPAILHLKQFNDFMEKLGPDLVVRGLGNENEFIADLVLLENKFTLGVTEDIIVSSLEKGATHFVEEEKKVRANLSQEEKIVLKDKVSRSFGLLANSFSLQMQETLVSLSLIHLGIELGWIQGAEKFDFYRLFFSLRRAHLLTKLAQSTSSPQEVSQVRAKILRDLLEGVRLTI